jgi:hypothetical protein
MISAKESVWMGLEHDIEFVLVCSATPQLAFVSFFPKLFINKFR